MFDRYRPNLPVNFLTSQLAFKEEGQCMSWLQELKVVFVSSDESKVDCKASSTILP